MYTLAIISEFSNKSSCSVSIPAASNVAVFLLLLQPWEE